MKLIYGFSLLELLIVMAIATILVSIAYPSYMSYQIRGRRSQAKVELLYISSQLESFYVLNNTYQGAETEITNLKAFTDDHSYQLLIQSATDSSYNLIATPLGPQALGDPDCGSLTYNELGERGASGIKSAENCWS